MDPIIFLSDPIFAPLLIAIGFLVGMSIGISGIGAPMLFPALILLGLPPQLVVGADLTFLTFTRAFATGLHAKHRTINWRALIYLVVPVAPSMIFGSWFWIQIKGSYGSEFLDSIILLLLGTLLLGLSVYLILFHLLRSQHWDFVSLDAKSSVDEYDKKLSLRHKVIWLLTGGSISFVYQISGLGAGSMMLPVLVKTLKKPLYAAGTMGAFGIVAASVGTSLHYTLGNIPFYVVALLLIGSLPGVFVGVRASVKISSKKMILVFALLIMASGIFLFLKWLKFF